MAGRRQRHLLRVEVDETTIMALKGLLQQIERQRETRRQQSVQAQRTRLEERRQLMLDWCEGSLEKDGDVR